MILRLLLPVAVFACLPLASETFIRHIIIDQRDVFDPESRDWFFLAREANSLHTETRSFVVEDEILFEEGEPLDEVLILETERNLRRTGLFSVVAVSVSDLGNDSVDVVVFTRDRWSLNPAILVGAGGGVYRVGGKVEELNVAGLGYSLGMQALYRTENDIGWEGITKGWFRRLARSELNLGVALGANQYRTEQAISLDKPFRTMRTPTAWSVSSANAFGRDFSFRNSNADPFKLLPFSIRRLRGWHSWSEGDVDRVFLSVLGSVEKVQRADSVYRQAFDNLGRFLISFASVRQDFSVTNGINGYETEDLQTGAWGSVALGRLFSLGNGADGLYYLSGQAEQSAIVAPDFYLFGRIASGTGLQRGAARYTYLETSGTGFYRINKSVVATARFRQQTAWNWQAFRQLILDNDAGLRGYDANSLAGDNRFVVNAELRWFPDVSFWIVRISAAAFHDIGTVWNQGTSIGHTRYHHSTGVGIRLHNLMAAGSDAVYRFDLAWNHDLRRFGGLVFTTQQMFSGFGIHLYRPPEILGTEIDLE